MTPYNADDYEGYQPHGRHIFYCTGGGGVQHCGNPGLPVKHIRHPWVGDAVCETHATPELWEVLKRG